MSNICIDNILPSRTRSGMKRVAKKEVLVSSQNDTARSNDTAQCIHYMELARELYTQQVDYIKTAKKDRTNKFEIMARYESLRPKIKELLSRVKESKTIDDVQVWVELVCWNTRITVFHQSVCVV